jgi:hypothetical protein
VLADYAAQLPLTIRQIFYRLVGADGYEKTEQAHKRLGELLNKARRARLIDMDAIRDDGFTSQLTSFFANAEAFINNAIAWAEELRLDRQKGQARRLVVWCEASGMVPQLARIADPYGIEVCSSGGFDSLTDKHRIGRLWVGRQAVTVLHLGDHDPSGVHVFSSLAEDIEEFAAGRWLSGQRPVSVRASIAIEGLVDAGRILGASRGPVCRFNLPETIDRYRTQKSFWPSDKRKLSRLGYDLIKQPNLQSSGAVAAAPRSAPADHCLRGTLGVLAQCETRSSGVHRSLLLKTTTHTLLSAGQSTVSSGLTLCRCIGDCPRRDCRRCRRRPLFRR